MTGHPGPVTVAGVQPSRFRHQGILVELTWPQFDPLCDDAVPASVTLAGRGWDPAETLAALDEECLAPVWVVTDLECRDATHHRCGCGVVDLAAALDAVAPADQQAVLLAHLDVIGQLSDHLDAAARLVAFTAPTRLPNEPVCPRCLMGDTDHVAALNEELLERCRQYALHAAGRRPHPSGSTPVSSAGPTTF